MQQQFGDINKRLDSFVPAQLHALYERRVDENLDRLKDDIADVKKDIEKDIADLVKLTNKNRTDSKQEIKDLKDGQRWWWTAVIVPGLLALIAIVGLVINIIRGG
jgi:cell division protein FtsB